jgi:beta-phosphoglucomutase-like phosphatase (HAD superfamily)
MNGKRAKTSKMHFTTVVCDMDGTLFDSERLAIECWQTAFREFGVLIAPGVT